jgi:hypothetical protein
MSDAERFRVRCHDCGRTVFSNVERIGEAEVRELRAHLTICRPDLVPSDRPLDLGALLAHFGVEPTSG